MLIRLNINMGFIDKLFGKKEPGTIETTIELLPSLLKNKFEFQEKDLEQYSAKKISEIKHLHKKALILLEDIQKKEINESKGGRFNKAAMTSKQQIENQLKRLLEKLSPDNRGLTLSDARAYSGEGYALMITEINTFRKSIFYTSAFLKEEMSELGKILQEIINSFNEMNNTFSKNAELFEFEKVVRIINNIDLEKKEISFIKKEVELNNKLVDEKKKELETHKKLVDEYLTSPGIEKLKDSEKERSLIAEKKQKLKFEVSSLLGSVDRPLQRLNSLSESNRWVLREDQKEILELILTNPLLALKKDTKAEKFKSVLEEVKKAIEEGKIELKEKEREKRLNALNELLVFDFFENVFWKLNEIQKEQDRLTKEISSNPAQVELNKKNLELDELKKEISSIEETNRKLGHKTSEIKKHVESEIKQLSIFVERVFQKKAIIKED